MRLAVLVFSLALGFSAPALAQLFEIAKPTFSSFVTDDGSYTPLGPATDGKISRATLSRGLLYFSFTVVGGQPAMDYVQEHNRLDVGVVILGDQSEIISGLGISQMKWGASKDAWLSQYLQLGYFTFRTYMNTQKFLTDIVELQIRDGKNNVVRPIASASLTYKASVAILP